MNSPFSPYKPDRGGHAPGHLRDAFIKAAEAVLRWRQGGDEPEIAFGLDAILTPASRVCRHLRLCSDPLPRGLADQLSEALAQPLPAGATYGDAAVELGRLIGIRALRLRHLPVSVEAA